jgi:hypothetical protein
MSVGVVADYKLTDLRLSSHSAFFFSEEEKKFFEKAHASRMANAPPGQRFDDENWEKLAWPVRPHLACSQQGSVLIRTF